MAQVPVFRFPVGTAQKPSYKWYDPSEFWKINDFYAPDIHLGADFNFGGKGEDNGEPVFSIFTGPVEFISLNYPGYEKLLIQYITINNTNYSIIYGHVQINSELHNRYLKAEAEGKKISLSSGEYIGVLYKYFGTEPEHLHFGVAKGHTRNVTLGFVSQYYFDKYKAITAADGVREVTIESHPSITAPTTFIDPIAFLNNRGYAAIEIGGIGGDIDSFINGEIIVGRSGNDVIYQNFDDDVIDGGGGRDSVIYNYSSSAYKITLYPDRAILIGPEGIDIIKNVESLIFRVFTGPAQSINLPAVTGPMSTTLDLLYTSGRLDPSLTNVRYNNITELSTALTKLSDWSAKERFETKSSLWDTVTSVFKVTLVAAEDVLKSSFFEDESQSIFDYSMSDLLSVDQVNDNSQWIAASDNGVTEWLLTSGTHTIRLASSVRFLDFGAAGKLSLQELANGAPSDDHASVKGSATRIGSSAIAAYTSITGVIETGRDLDFFSAELLAGQRYAVMLWANPDQTGKLDPALQVTSPGGTVWSNDNLTNSTTTAFLAITAPTSGLYTFRASSSAGTSGKYSLTITPVSTDPKAGTITDTGGKTDPGNSVWDWQGTSGEDNFPTPGWDGNKGNLSAANRLRGHGDNDTIKAGGGNDVVWGDAGGDDLYGEDGNDTIRGGTSSDRIWGGNGDDLIYGEDGNDNIQGDISISTGSGNDTVYGGDGNDDINGGRGNDYIKGEDDDDDIDGDDGDDQLFGDGGNDEVDGDAGDDLVFGGPGNDDLGGGTGRDRLAGEAGDDLLDGDDGDDVLYGGNDTDVLKGGRGNDLLHGEAGIDTADFSDGNLGVVINLFDQIANSSDLGTDTLYGIENIIGSDGNDVIDANHERNILDGGDGNDIIRGHNGNDVINGGRDNDVVWGDAGDDVVDGGDDDDEIRGGLGNDTLRGGAGDDRLRGEQNNDIIDGGTGFDSVFFWGEREDFRIEKGTGGQIIVTDLRGDGKEGTDILTNIEEIEFFDVTILVSDIIAAAPIALPDTQDVANDRFSLVDVLANDTINASAAKISKAEIKAGGGSLLMVNGEIVFDPGTGFEYLRKGQSAIVDIAYEIETAGFQSASATARLVVRAPQFDSAEAESLVLFRPGTRDLIAWDSTQDSNGFTYFLKMGAGSTVKAVADFTGDGRADVLLSQTGGSLVRWDTTLGGNGFAVLPAAPGFEVIGRGDLVGNSATDLLLKNAAGQLRILDPVAGTITDLFGLASGWSVTGVGNINGTGKDDVVLHNANSGAVIAFTDQGWRDLITLAPGWTIGGLGDVVGGLADDFILQRNDGVTIFWDATQGSNGWSNFATVGPAWDFLGFDDLNGDGRDDVVLQNDNGLAIYWTGSNWVDLGSTLIGTEVVGTGVFP
jgi:Ca2+-binding RTX toxin-like protein